MGVVWWLLAWNLLAPIVTVACHEAAHAFFALSLTRGPVLLSVGRHRGRTLGRVGRMAVRVSPWPDGGFCGYLQPARPGDRALIAAAGPVSSLLLAAIAWHLHETWAAGHAITLAVAVTSLLAALTTAYPTYYALESDQTGVPRPSDGMQIVLALWPGSRLARRAPRRPLIAPHVSGRPEKAIRAPFAIALAVVALLVLLVALAPPPSP